MQLFVINDICCPNLIDSVSCHGQLELEKSTVLTRYVPNDDNEVIEGLLICQHCHEVFPILGGIPILVVNPWLYLRDSYDIILALTTEAGIPISPSYISVLQERAVNIAPKSKGGNKYDQRDTLSGYLCQHYDTVWDMLPPTHPIWSILQLHYPKDFYSIAVDMLATYLETGQKVLDIGCGVGRSVYEFATRSKFVFGVEYSYASAFLARRILRQFPSNLESYWLKLDGDIYIRRPLPERKRDNVEIVVASGDNLPFSTGEFDLTSSWNVIDRVPTPERIITEQERALKPGGIMALIDPYAWDTSYTSRAQWIGGQKSQRSINAVQELVKKTSDLLDEREYIPWLSWIYERNFHLFYCHALIARKRVMEKPTE